MDKRIDRLKVDHISDVLALGTVVRIANGTGVYRRSDAEKLRAIKQAIVLWEKGEPRLR